MYAFLERIVGQITRQSASVELIRPNGVVFDSFGVTMQPQTIVAAAAFPIDCADGLYVVNSQTTNVAQVISEPTNPILGQTLIIEFRNTSGGAAGAVTWNAVFKIGAAWTSAATGFNRRIAFYFNGTNWVELYRQTVDVTN